MAPKLQKNSKQANSALLRAIYWAIIVGIVALVVIVTVEAIIDIVGVA